MTMQCECCDHVEAVWTVQFPTTVEHPSGAHDHVVTISVCDDCLPVPELMDDTEYVVWPIGIAREVSA